jgi:hypothetical protein
MKDKYNVNKKKIVITSAPPSDWPWYKTFDSLCGDTAKIDGLPP